MGLLCGKRCGEEPDRDASSRIIIMRIIMMRFVYSALLLEKRAVNVFIYETNDDIRNHPNSNNRPV